MGTCFMPGETTCSDDGIPSASLPCSACNTVIAGSALDTALDHEARYGFVVQFGSMYDDANTAKGLASGAVMVFRHHWIVAAVLKALEKHCLASSELSMGETTENLHRAAFQRWPWLLRMNAGTGLAL
eukprot:TRINITY_DN49155_c0_g1_i1.p1 TRINITY_DN49155_c0_g1~~TRINITY_DN49155_c0_g1_i1.p1  ORF type:complete len:128 (+),score=17.24 TRINITY_DN49155_c0_g1_i1:218-601(+)